MPIEDFVFFGAFRQSVGPLCEKKYTDAQRRKCACMLVRKMIWDLISDENSKLAVEVSEQFAEGKTDKKGLLAARKGALRVWKSFPDYLVPPPEWSIKQTVDRQVAHICLGVTATPFPGSNVIGTGEMIANTLAHKAAYLQTGEVMLAVTEKAFEQMRGFILEFIKKKTEIESAVPSNQLVLDCSYGKSDRSKYIRPSSLRSWAILNLDTDKQIALAALDCFDRCTATKSEQPPSLDPITQLAQSEKRDLREMAVSLLLLLGEGLPTARSQLRSLLLSKNGDVRFTALSHLQYFRPNFPKEFLCDFIRQSLTDRSARMRQMAGQACVAFELVEMIPDLESKADVEKNPKLRENLTKNAHLLNHGFYVSQVSGAHPTLVVKTKRGYSSHEIPSPLPDLEGLRKLADGIKQRQETGE
ncbi:MAG: hypothetical protein L0Y72_01460 [Gemmataceae bacterium]|nr:hypothetical protein [Gemmataceae bacterium]MCI0737681.1 hypothetical protein [Gemmataceae bacterium]